jgi:hypothetical protein
MKKYSALHALLQLVLGQLTVDVTKLGRGEGVINELGGWRGSRVVKNAFLIDKARLMLCGVAFSNYRRHSKLGNR